MGFLARKVVELHECIDYALNSGAQFGDLPFSGVPSLQLRHLFSRRS
jgi:hypothetical protein